MKKRKIVPSFLTSMNLLCGFIAILINDPIISFYMVLVGISFDFVDGFSARALKVPSLFGKELDSLADMVTFGVVPGFLYYHHILQNDSDSGVIFYLKLVIATLIPVLVSLRLAKYNVKDSGKIGFAGLPSSAAALLIISIPFLVHAGEIYFVRLVHLDWVALLLPIPFALLMVTNLPMFSFKSFKAGIKGNTIQLIYVVSVILMAIFLGWSALPLSIFWYVILSLLTVRIWMKVDRI